MISRRESELALTTSADGALGYYRIGLLPESGVHDDIPDILEPAYVPFIRYSLSPDLKSLLVR